MTDMEFRSLRAGDKIFVSGLQIMFDAVVTGPHEGFDQIPIEVIDVYYRAPDLDRVYQAYRAGYRTTENNRPALLRGWISEGARR